MPLYEYGCKACGNQFEELLSMSFKGSVPCPACGSADTGKRLSLFAARVATGDGGYRESRSGSSCSGCTSGNCSSCGH